MVGALVGVAALVGAGTFAVTQIRSNSSDGGGSSPQDVGEKFVKALNGEDLLGTVDLLLPGERDTFRQPLIDLTSELNRLQVTDNEVNLNQVPGFDIAIDSPDISVSDTNVSDIADVEITGSITVTVNGEDVPIGKLLIDRVFDGERPTIDSSEKTSDFDLTFATVKRGGRWYLSMFYSLANTARGDQDIPDTGITPVGASTPDGAMDAMIKAIGELDLEKVIADLNPNEASALQRYAPLFLDDAQQQLDDQDVSIDIGKTEYSVTGSGNTRQVAITRLEFTSSANGTDVDFTLRDGCIEAASGDTTFNTCAGDDNMDSSIDSYLDQLGMSATSEVNKLVKDVRAAFSDFQMHGIVVDRVDGSWYVSPIGTSAELFLSFLRALDRDEIDTIINDGRAAFNSLSDSFDSSGFPGGDDGTTTDSTDTGDTGKYWFDCLSEASDQISMCIQDGIASGDWQAEEIPAPYLYPECGLSDYYNGGELYDDTPEAFHAKIDPALPCITEAAAKDGIDLLSSSPEFARPDCYADINPYFYDGANPDASQAAFTCAYSGD